MDKLDQVVNRIQEELLGDARSEYSGQVMEYFQQPRNVGSIPETPYFAHVTGACGDTMQLYLHIADDTVKRAMFNTDGCISTIACGSAITEMLINQPVREVLRLSPAHILADLDGLPERDHHCAVLTIITLYTALGKYLTRPQQGDDT